MTIEVSVPIKRRYGQANQQQKQRQYSSGAADEYTHFALNAEGSRYSTALVGKWHLGYPPTFGPLRSGYDEFFGIMAGGVDYFTHCSGLGDHDLYFR
jgi:arylsulfatase A-like enzyme